MKPFQACLLRRTALTLGIAATLLLPSGFAQTSTQMAQGAFGPPSLEHKGHIETSFSLGAFAQFTATRIDDSNSSFVTQSMTPSAGVLGTFRQSFKPWLGYSVNVGYTHASVHFTDNAGYGSSGSVVNFSTPANTYEFSLSYLAQKHLNRKLTGFADLGAGMLNSLPTHRPANPNGLPFLTFFPNANYRPVGVGGIGVDYLVNPHVSIRAEYRSLVHKFADFGYESTKQVTLTSEPTVSLVYNFKR